MVQEQVGAGKSVSFDEADICGVYTFREKMVGIDIYSAWQAPATGPWRLSERSPMK